MPNLADTRLAGLMADVAGENEAAFEEVFAIAVSRVHAVAKAVLHSSEDAKEIVAEVFQFIWTNAARYDESRGSVIAWLTMITRRRAIDRLRKRTIQISLDDVSYAHIGRSLIAPTPDPLAQAQSFQEQCAVHSALMALSPLRRSLVLLAFFNGLSHVEIALETNLSLGTVKSHVRRALLSMRRQLSVNN